MWEGGEVVEFPKSSSDLLHLLANHFPEAATE
jgi:hypothetical protein